MLSTPNTPLLRQSNSKSASWKQYMEQNQFEDGYLEGPARGKFFDELTVMMHNVLKQPGAKVVR